LQDECLKVLEQIELFLDGELDVDVGRQIRQHLEACGPCMDHSEFQRHLKELVREKCGCDQAPARLLERIRSALAEPAP
jgi:mycothiol system anti-sigma-R factor